MFSPRVLLWGLLIIGAGNLLRVPAPDVPAYGTNAPFVVEPEIPSLGPNSDCDPAAWEAMENGCMYRVLRAI